MAPNICNNAIWRFYHSRVCKELNLEITALADPRLFGKVWRNSRFIRNDLQDLTSGKGPVEPRARKPFVRLSYGGDPPGDPG